MYNYDRMGGGQEYEEHKKHIGAALIMTGFSIAMIWSYAHWLNYVDLSGSGCCVYEYSDGSFSSAMSCDTQKLVY